MPLIELTAPEGSLTESGRATIPKKIVATLMRWEGAPDNAFFRYADPVALAKLDHAVEGLTSERRPTR